MKLANLIDGMPKGLIKPPAKMPDLAITDLYCDSRLVTKGSLFTALPGVNVDGVTFIPSALEKGAQILLVDEGAQLPKQVIQDQKNRDLPIVLQSPNPRAALAHLAAKFYTPQPDFCAAVTGTNGKTSIANFCRQLWANLGQRAASFGTIGAEGPDGKIKLGHTTPDPITLHKTLAQLVREQQVTHLALEASSHGLAQHRLDGVNVQGAAFTNITRDHLDYHGSLEAYFAEKKKLFENLLTCGGTVVVDPAIPGSEDIIAIAKQRALKLLTVGKTGKEIQILSSLMGASGTDLTLKAQEQTFEIKLPLVGGFQITNALLAAGLIIASGFPPEKVLPLLETLKGAPGRLELAGQSKNGGMIFIDYAHTSDALLNVLQALRPFAKNQLGVVFGCGGDRDQGKRPLMGKVASKGADFVIVTDDNPRTEDPALIRSAILKASSSAIEIADRRQAIEKGIGMLKQGDILLIAGKGHETGQIIGDKILPFSDHQAVKEVLS